MTILILIIILLLGFVFWDLVDSIKKKIHSIDCKDSYKLTDLFIVPFYNNGQKLNFIIDSGSTTSLLDIKTLSKLDYERAESVQIEMCTVDGNKTKEWVPVLLNISNKLGVFNQCFYANDTYNLFADTEETYGEPIAGILGNDFLVAYNRVLDFEKLKVI